MSFSLITAQIIGMPCRIRDIDRYQGRRRFAADVEFTGAGSLVC
jgi:hypothetical protein